MVDWDSRGASMISFVEAVCQNPTTQIPPYLSTNASFTKSMQGSQAIGYRSKEGTSQNSIENRKKKENIFIGMLFFV